MSTSNSFNEAIYVLSQLPLPSMLLQYSEHALLEPGMSSLSSAGFSLAFVSYAHEAIL